MGEEGREQKEEGERNFGVPFIIGLTPPLSPTSGIPPSTPLNRTPL